ncbi:uncharacterized protein LOC105254987 [Camponotus floridanus]|nr:uncharacterized protein LOC105254987 [Camponotus floridanus]
MATIDFRHLSVLITLFAAALTSSVNAGRDGAASAPPIPTSFPSPKLSSPIVEHSSDVIDNKKIHASGLAEGGPILISPIQNANIESTAAESREEKNNSSSLLSSETKKIKARKGVDQNQDPQMANILLNQTTLEDIRPVMEIAETARVNNQSEASTFIPKLNVTNLHINNSLDAGANFSYSSTSSISNITTVHTKTTNYTTTSKASHTEKHVPKPKPTVTTVDGPDPSESRLSSRKKNPPLGMPRKIDYIIPVIITIVALPILGAAIFVLYRRGRDCWDKRHYRRMDFLIDGMYND